MINSKQRGLIGFMFLLGVIAVFTAYSLFSIAENVEIIVDKERDRIVRDSKPPSDYFTYFSVKPTKEEFAVGESITLVSHKEIVTELAIGGTDRLYCDTEGNNVFTQISFADWSNNKPKNGTVRKQWTYLGSLPENPRGTYIEAKCYIRSYIFMNDGGSLKEQVIISEPEFSVGIQK